MSFLQFQPASSSNSQRFEPFAILAANSTMVFLNRLAGDFGCDLLAFCNFNSKPPCLAQVGLCSVGIKNSGNQKAHQHKHFGPVALGRPRFGPGTNLVCPMDKCRFSPYFSQWKPTCPRPGTKPVCPATNWGGRARKSLCVKKFMCLFCSLKMLSSV